MGHKADLPYLFYDLDESERNALLAKVAKRMKSMDKDLFRKVTAIDKEERLARTPHKAYFSAPNLMEDFMTEHGGGIILDDGWFRLVIETKLGALEIYNGQRFETPDLGFASKIVVQTEEQLRAPTLKIRPAKGMMKKKVPAWRVTGTVKVHLVLIRESEDRNFYLDWPEEVRGVPGRKVYFRRRFSPSDRGPGWFMVRPHNLSRFPIGEEPPKPPPVKKTKGPAPKPKSKAVWVAKARVKCSKCGRSIFEHPSGMCLPCRS